MHSNKPTLAECIIAIVLVILASIEVFPDSIQQTTSETSIILKGDNNANN